LLPRTLFYPAQTYRDLGKLDQSVDTYRKRVELGGWAEEVWYSLYQIAWITEFQRRDDALVAHHYLQAYQYRPSRAEPLVHLAAFHRKRRQYAVAHLYAQRAMAIPQTTDVLFVEGDCYGWRRLDEYAVASYWVGDFKTCERSCLELLASPALPESHASRVRENLEFAQAKLR
jgi:tetratricopeptide (TPR) repeat protein